jgi:hypothetical protein
MTCRKRMPPLHFGHLPQIPTPQVHAGQGAEFGGDSAMGLRLCTFVHIMKFDELRMGSQQSEVKL